mmetsp:Transcript_2340/g.1682  ORF Transcript_2340/g.1682 Transcript_2340/m.1682 type:complete len:139 (+) Transcript_2340:509-925(+)
MPWPFQNRDFVNGSIVRVEPMLNAVMLCSSSVEHRESYFGESIPKVPEGHVRAHTNREIHFIQKLDQRKTKYISMFNSDIKLSKMPNFLINWILKKVCEQLADIVKEKAEVYDTLGLREKRKVSQEFYDSLDSRLRKN